MSFQAAVGEPKLKDDVADPEGILGIIEPLTKIEPDICTLFPAANIKFERVELFVPFPSIKAPAVELVILYKP